MRVALVGGGHAHIAALRLLARRHDPSLSVTLISRARETLYSGMLPGVIRGDYGEVQARVDVMAEAVRAGANFVLGEAVGLHLAEREVRLGDGRALPFDVVSLDVGGRSAPLPGAIPVRPIEGLLSHISALDRLGGGAPVAVAGGGPAGVELALALARHWREHGRGVVIATREGDILPGVPRAVRAYAASALARAGVALRCGWPVTEWADGVVLSEAGTTFKAEALLAATHTVAPGWLAATGLATDASGCVRVDAALRSVSHPFVLAAGDCAALPVERPKGGVWAVRAGAALVATLRALARGAPPPAWSPPREAVQAIGIGGGRAVLWRGRFVLAGRAAWWFKEGVDRRWVAG